MLLSIGLIVAGLAVVVFSSEQLVKGTVGFARGLGVSAFLVSVIFLGFDPENLAVGAVGSFEGATGIALGTVIGSAMVAVALAVGIAALVAPMRFGQVSNKVIAVPIAATVLLGGLAVDGRLSRIDGVILLAAYAAAVLYLIWLARRGESVEASGEVGKELGKPEGLGTAKSAAVVVVSLLFIIAGSELLVTGVRDVINRFGVSETAIGMTVVALAISLEEVARTVPAARAGRADVVYGNVAGSILAFFLFNAGVIALISPLDVGTSTLRFYLPAAAGVVVLVSAFLLTRRLPRWAGALLVAAYLAFAAGGYLLYGAQPADT